MKYAYEERLEIGSKLYHNELSRAEASEQYGISVNSARDSMRLYRAGCCPRRSARAGAQQGQRSTAKNGCMVEGVGKEKRYSPRHEEYEAIMELSEKFSVKFRVKGVYYELTLYMDLWNEIVAHALSARRGDSRVPFSKRGCLISSLFVSSFC